MAQSGITKAADAKGRITLGKRFANRQVIIEDISETEVKVSLARVIPEREMWLWENPKARNQVVVGLEQAAAGAFTDEPPNIDSDRDLAEQLEE